MRRFLVCVLLSGFVGLTFAAPPARAEPPDPAFSQETEDYITAKKDEFLARIIAAGQIPSPQQEGDAWCRAAMWWKMSNPGGEARLTLDGLSKLRRLEVMCGQRMRRAPILPDEPQSPPATRVNLPAEDPVTNDRDVLDDNDGTRQALEDFMRWHPDEFQTGESEADYVARRLLWWDVLGPGARLAGAIAQPVGVSGGGMDLSGEEHVYNAARAAEEERLRREWRAAHPGEPIPPEPAIQGPASPPPGFTVDPYRGGLVPLPPPGYVREPWRGNLVPDPDSGSLTPVDLARWQSARQPIEVGPNDEIGSGARQRDQLTGAAAGLVGGLLGVSGGRRSSRDSGPRLTRCRLNARDMAHFQSGGGDVGLDALARRDGNRLTVFADVAQSPDTGTFQAVALQNQFGQILSASNVQICELYGEWRLSVSWTSTSYLNGRQTGQQSGGWTDSGLFGLPGSPSGPWPAM